MLLKFIFGATMVAFTTFCGYLFARKYRQRKLFFAQFSEFNDRYISEISYSRRPIKTFISAYAYKGEFDTFLRKYFEVLESGQTRMHGFDFKTELSFLKQEERQIVLDYFIMLGKGDSVSQKGYFSTIKERLHSLASLTENEHKKYGNLYVKIGFLCGLFILILII